MIKEIIWKKSKIRPRYDKKEYKRKNEKKRKKNGKRIEKMSNRKGKQNPNTQKCKPSDATRHPNSIKLLILLPLRAI